MDRHRLACRLAAALLVLGAGAPVALAQATDPARAALEGRLLQLEEEVRQLTGRIEQLEYQQSRLAGQADAGSDRAGGYAGPAPGALAGGSRVPALPPEPPAPPIPGSGTDGAGPRRLTTAAPPAGQMPADIGGALGPPVTAPDVEPDAAAAKGYVLGTIPRDAARNAPTGAPVPTGSSGGPMTPRGPTASEVGYDGALKLLQAGKWQEAQGAFQGFLDRNPSDARAANAAYWLGETFYYQKDYQSAATAFAKNYKTYGPDAAKAPDNLLKLGMSLAALGKKDQACVTFAALATRHPNAAAAIKQTLARERSADGCAA